MADDDWLDLYDDIAVLETKLSAQSLAIETLSVMVHSALGERKYNQYIEERVRFIDLWIEEAADAPKDWAAIKKEFLSIMERPVGYD